VTGYAGPAILGGPSDAGLVRAAQQGDAASLGALLDRYHASLYACGLACLSRPEDAADAVQETFLLALTRLSQVRDSYLSLAGQDPEPYAAMFASGAEIATSGLVVQGRDQIRQMCEQDLADGIGTRLVDVLSSAAITVIESEWVSPPDDPQHCPPGVTQVLFHDGTDQVRRSLGYFPGSPVQGPA
jgi:hypothetical protein